MNIKLAAIALSFATALVALPAQAQTTRPSQIGPSLSFGGGSTILGVESKFPLTSNISLRPTAKFPSGGVVVGSSVTYDFTNFGGDFRFDPYAGVGFNVYTGDNRNNGTNFVGYLIGGADFFLSDQFNLTGNVNIPLTSGYSTDVGVGIAYKF